MPKVARALSALEVRRIKRPGLHPVGGVAGVQLQISPTGSRSWILRATIAGKRRDIGLGPVTEVSLAEAREAARTMRRQIRAGIDPLSERQAAKAKLAAARAATITFDEAAKKLIASKQAEFRNAKHAKQWRSTLDRYASPVIGKLPVSEIDTGHIVRVLEPYWTEKPETMSRVRGRVESVLDWAGARALREGPNPARWRGHLDALLPRPSKIKRVEHHRALPIGDVPEFVAELRQRKGAAARALEFTILCAARSGEARGATWSEIDLDGALWRVPGQRMKAGREHTVPLSPAALALLKALPHRQGLLFPAPRGGQLSDMALTAVIRRMGYGERTTAHGFRACFSTWASERTHYPSEVREMALAHRISNKAEAAYRRGDLLGKRGGVMDAWAQFCASADTATPTATTGAM